VAGVTQLDHCIGCNRFGVVEQVSSICARCLYGRNRGLKWALWMDRCRRDPRWARAVYDRISTERGRRTFIEVFGLPPRFAEEGDTVTE
jgi:hypothetical protein